MAIKDILFRSAHSLAWVAAAGFVLAGCSRFQEDDLFDESASQRITHFNEDLRSRLVEQSSDDKNGWVIQYFVASEFEGFNLFGSFYDNGKVKIAGNHRFLRGGNAGKYTESLSYYQMLSEDGPVLSFNTWNDVLTVFVDPVDPTQAPSQLVSDGEGMHGDQNLVFQGYKDSTILFSGERNSGRVRLVPCDRPWQDYIKDTEATRNYITNTTITSYYVVCGTDTLYFKNLRNGLFTYCERVNDPLFPSTVNCVFTPTGFYMQHRNSIAGTSFQEFTLSEDKSCLVSENDSVKVIPTWDNYIVNVRSTTWSFDQDGFTDEQKDLLSQIDAELKKFNKNYSLAEIGLGRSSGNGAVKGLVVTFYANTAKTKTNTAGLSLTITRPSFGQMQISYSEEEKTDKNLSNMNAKSDVEKLVRQFAASLSGLYNIIPDDHFLPTGCELRSVDGSNCFTLN